MAANIFSLEVVRARKATVYAALRPEERTRVGPDRRGTQWRVRAVPPSSARGAVKANGAGRRRSAARRPVHVSHSMTITPVGLLGLTGELVETDDKTKPKIVRIPRPWHNTFDDIVGNDARELGQRRRGAIRPAAPSGECLPPEVLSELEEWGTRARRGLGEGARRYQEGSSTPGRRTKKLGISGTWNPTAS